jgi:hypothetical protein
MKTLSVNYLVQTMFKPLGRSTDDERAAKRARREGPKPASDPFIEVRHE